LRLNAAFTDLASVLTYIRVYPNTNVVSMESQIQEAMERRAPVPRGPNGKPIVPIPKLFVQPLTQIHFVPAGAHAMKPSGNLSAIWAITGIGLLILVVASINYVNMMTARTARRSMEVGVRKMAGATRQHLMLQFMGESFLTVAVSCLLATSLVELLLPYFNAYLGRDIDFAWWRDPQLAISLTGAILVVGILGSVYPALILSGLRTVTVFGRQKVIDGQSELSRSALVTFQFAVLIGLLFATGMVYLQTYYATRDSLIFNPENVLVVDTDCRNAFPEEVRKLKGVKTAACTDAQFGIGGGWEFVVSPPDGSQPSATTMVNADPQLLPLFDLKPLAGRFFSRDRSADVMTLSTNDQRDSGSGAVVINETAMRKLGYKSPDAAIGHAAAFRGQADMATNYSAPAIIGVVKDFPLQGIRHEIQPTAFQWLPGSYKHLMVKLDGSATADTLLNIDKLWAQTSGPEPIRRRFLDSAIDALYVDIHREWSLFASLAVIAVFIACLGMFGLSTCIAERRTREIGIRKALGAETVDIATLFLWKFAKPILLANIVAWPVAGYLIDRWLHGFFYHVDINLWMYAIASCVALLLGLLTVAGHTLAVAQAKPIEALRYE
jgi:putative ABC transport system permease protein